MTTQDAIEEFAITGEYIELCNVLKVMGWVSTGGMAKQLVADGMVTVNGATELRKRYKTRPGDVVAFEDHVVRIVGGSV
ncbi:MAG: RNA-binding S4 domain-containing protein [Candidatus Kapabacteria bacterium]|nr:RNA-binding S4 domain-containing protein [Candidatus Kapabacteria bacterium]